MNYAVTLSDIEEARERIRGVAHRTAVHTSRTLNTMAGCEVVLKCENFQRVGAFKFRGAYNALAQIKASGAATTVVTHSSGNHAQAVALAARELGLQAHIVMPTSAPAVKREAVAGYGARIVDCQPTLEARETTAQRVIEETGGEFVHPYDDPRVMSGQGTVGLELLEQAERLDAIIVPVGGGGLLSGICVAARAISPHTTIYAAEPVGADDAARSFAAGEWLPQTQPNTIADGLLTSLGHLTWPIIRDHVKSVITVTDDQIRNAMQLLWERVKIVVEPSGAVGLAALLGGELAEEVHNGRVGIVLTGGNVPLPVKQ